MESKVWFNTVLQNTCDAVIAADKQGKILIMNPMAETLTGWKQAECHDMPLSDIFHIVHQYTRKRIVNPIAEILNGGQKENFTNRTELVTKSGQRIQISCNASPVVDVNGIITGALLVFREITKENRLQSALLDHEEMFNAILKNINGMIWIVDTKLCLTVLKGRQLSDLNLDPNKITGMSIYDYFKTKDLNHPIIAAHHRVLKGETVTLETTHNGTIYTSVLYPIKNIEGHTTGVVGFAQDISKDKQTEAEINKHIQEQNILLKVSHSMSRSLDLDYVLQVISDGTATLLNIETAAVYLLEGQELYLGATTPALDPGMPDFLRRASLNDHPHIKQTVDTRKPVILRDTNCENLTEAEKNVVDIRKLRSLIYLPFLQEEQVIGVLILGTIGQVREFTDNEIELCHTISNQLSLGVQNARLHAGLLKYTKELEEQIKVRKRAEEQIQKDLREKEVMLKEIHHRVKNNLNVCTSLLKLQAQRIQSKEQALSAFSESCDRIYSMALIHEQLYKSVDFAKIDMKQYIKTISHILKKTYASRNKIALELHIDNVFLDINQAIPCGLILNEWITNAYKHAFPDNRDGRIRIEFHLTKKDDYKLTFKDTGVGLPDGINIENSETLGLHLIYILTRQIEGKLEIKSDQHGTTFNIRFPPN